MPETDHVDGLPPGGHTAEQARLAEAATSDDAWAYLPFEEAAAPAPGDLFADAGQILADRRRECDAF